MGEIVKLTTWPNQRNKFYKITSNCMKFELKAPGNPGIGLSSKVKPNCDIFIGIAHDGNSWIKGIREKKETVNTPIILSTDNYKRFWISWYSSIIRLGLEGETQPILSFSSKDLYLKYITFIATDDNINPVHWILELPVLLERLPIKPIKGGKLYWVRINAGKKLPDDAYIGGYEKENLYIIRAKHADSLSPGKFVTSEGLGYIPYLCNVVVKTSFEVLCGYDCIWVELNTLDHIPLGAVVAGHSQGSCREKLYIGRAKYSGHIIPGKVMPSFKMCCVPYNGQGMFCVNFEIMIVPDQNRPNSINKFLQSGMIECEVNDKKNMSIDDYCYDHYYSSDGRDSTDSEA